MKPFRILHITDVHFGGGFSSEVWSHVRLLVRNSKPRLIACTGDLVDHGGIFKLAMARQELELLALESGDNCVVRAVPGNHDVALYGNLRVFRSNRAFNAVFGTPSIAAPPNLPRYETYAVRRWIVRLALWLKFTLMLHFRALRLRFTEGRPTLPLSRKDDPPEVFLAYADSNFKLAAATGQVDARHLAELQSVVVSLKKGGSSKFFVPRILMVHHHPAPIAYSDVRETLTSFEPFLMLRNAGTLVRELAKNDFDLILHGHKHYSGLCRMSFGLVGSSECDVGVLAAGSAGLKQLEAGRNSANLIDVYPNGQLRFNQIMFGSGQSVQSCTLEETAHLLHSVATQKQRNFFRAVEVVGQRSESIERHLEIDEQGAAHVRFRCEKLRVVAGELNPKKTIRMQVSVGLINPDAVALDEPSRTAGLVLQTRTWEPARVIVADLDFGEPLSRLGTDISYGYRYTTLGTFALTAWEQEQTHLRAQRQGDPEINLPGHNSFNLFIRFPTDQARMTLSLPTTVRPSDIHVRVLRPASYPAALGVDEAGYDAHQEKWEMDRGLSDYEKRHLRQTAIGKWSLEIERPLVGYRYELSWRVVSSEEAFSQVSAACALGERARLYSASDTLADVNAKIGTFLGLVATFVKQTYGANGGFDECVGVALFCYHAETQSLVLVAEGNTAGHKIPPRFEVPLGVGMPGIAFKRRRLTSYLSTDITGDASHGMYLYEPRNAPSGMPPYKLVLAFPVFAADDRPVTKEAQRTVAVRAPREAIGVLTISTTAFDSKLTRMVIELSDAGTTASSGDASTAEVKRVKEEVEALVDLSFDAILRLVHGEPT